MTQAAKHLAEQRTDDDVHKVRRLTEGKRIARLTVVEVVTVAVR